MEIKDKEGKSVIRFSDFKIKYHTPPIFIDALVEVVLGNSTAKEIVTLEFLDLINFVQNLEKLREGSLHTFYLKQIDEQLEIKFVALITGNVKIEGFLRDKEYKTRLNFSFETSPIELFSLRDQIENLTVFFRNEK